MEKLVILGDNDNVAIATSDLAAQDVVETENGQLKLITPVSVGNKVALVAMKAGTQVIKAGMVIGHLTNAVQAGQLVDHENLTSDASDQGSTENSFDLQQYISEQTFMGYRRANGKVGIRNDLFIVPTVGCITPLMDVMVQQFKAVHPDNGSFDNIVLLKHPYGCSQLGDDFEQTRQILCDAVMQPNAGGVLVFGLGCENNQMAGMKETLEKMGGIDPQRMKFLVAQEVKDEFANAQQLMEELNDAAANDRREAIPLSELKVGLQSVQPDALAPITADRLLGYLADVVNANGGTTALTGLPNLAAAKGDLLNRASSDQVAGQINHIFAHLAAYYDQFDEQMVKQTTDKEMHAGVSTPLERAANELQIAGHAKINAALAYDQKLTEQGLNLIETPNNDLIDSSAEASADCQLVVVSAGVATPYASYVPSVKVASQTALAKKKQHWFDFDGGQVLTRPFTEVAKEFVDYIVQVASGEATRNEKAGLHGLAIFKIGVTE